jgi:hypothetical protein
MTYELTFLHAIPLCLFTGGGSRRRPRSTHYSDELGQYVPRKSATLRRKGKETRPN